MPKRKADVFDAIQEHEKAMAEAEALQAHADQKLKIAKACGKALFRAAAQEPGMLHVQFWCDGKLWTVTNEGEVISEAVLVFERSMVNQPETIARREMTEDEILDDIVSEPDELKK